MEILTKHPGQNQKKLSHLLQSGKLGRFCFFLFNRFAQLSTYSRTLNKRYQSYSTVLLLKLSSMQANSFLFVILEMVDAMKKVAALKTNLSFEERNLLSVAYKNVIGARRASWRIISSIEQKEEKNTEKLQMIHAYLKAVEKEIADICNDILYVIDEYLLESLDDNASDADEAKVFYYKM